VERAIVIRAADLSLAAARVAPRVVASSRSEYVQKEAQRLLFALEAERWNVSRVAKNLGIPRNTLQRKLALYGLSRQSSANTGE
jgi:transcriptional regulator of acetoin/glycerol metabolism